MKKMKYNKYDFEIPERVLNYGNEWKKCLKFQLDRGAKFKEIYDKYEDLDTAVKNLQTDLFNLLESVASEYVDFWLSNGYLSMDKDVFLKEYIAYTDNTLNILQECESVEDKYAEIVMSKEEAEEYRRLRKASRGRWQGGGFGLGGALKGAATAGSLNVVTGIGHSIANGIGNMVSSMQANSAKRKIYRDKGTYDRLEIALKRDIVNLFETQMSLLVKENPDDYFRPSGNDITDSKIILKNIVKLEMSEEEVVDNVYRLFQMNPCSKDFYIFLLERYGDEKKELQPLAELFGYDDDVAYHKRKSLKTMVTEASFKKLNEAEESMKKINDFIQFYGIDIQSNQDIYSEAMKQYETTQIDDIVGKIDYHSKESVDKAVEAISNLKLVECSAENYIEEIRQKEGETRKQKEDEIIAEILKDIDYYDDEQVEMAIAKLQKEEFLVTDINTILNDIKKNTRKLDGILYKTKSEMLQVLSWKNQILMQAQSLVDSKRYEDAINFVLNSQLPEKSKNSVVSILSKYLISSIAEIYEYSKEYENRKEDFETFGGSMIIAIVVVIIGYLVSIKIWHFALYIGLFLGGVAIVQGIGYLFKNKKYKDAYNMINKLREIGYSIN